MRDYRKYILIVTGLGSMIMVCVGFSRIPSQPEQIISDSTETNHVSNNYTAEVVNSTGFIIAMTSLGVFILSIGLYVYLFSEICTRDTPVALRVSVPVAVAVAVAVAAPAPVPVPVPVTKTSAKVAPLPIKPILKHPRSLPLSVYGPKADIYIKTIAQRYPTHPRPHII